MENIFLKYMNEKLSVSDIKSKTPGPIITISREYGTYGSQIAELLVNRINTESNAKWKWISNEILNKVAQNLMVSPDKIAHVFGANVKGSIEEFFSSFSVSQRYVSDENVIKYISDIVTSYANEGNVVIVGRAGCVLTKHIPKSMHVKIIAPINWRVENIRKRFNISASEAKTKVIAIDEKRKQFMDLFKGNKPDSEIFDIILNRATLSNVEIISTIYSLAQAKSII